MSLGDLNVNLSADIANFKSAMDKAAYIAEKNAKKFDETFKNVGLSLGAGISLAGITALAKHSLEVSDNLSKLSQKVGISTESLSALSYAAGLSDVDFATLSGSLAKFNKNIAETAGKAEGTVSAFSALGITQKQLRDNTPDEIFARVAQRFSEMEDGAGKTALAMELFGKSGSGMIPLLNSGADGLKEMREEAEKFGVIISSETGKQAEEFNDNLTRLQNGFRGIVNQVMARNLPAMVAFSDQVIATAKDTEAMAKAADTVAAGFKLSASAAAVVIGVFKVAGSEIASIAAALVFAAEGEFEKAWEVLGEGGKDIIGDIKGTADSIESIWDDAAKKTEATAPAKAKKLAAPLITANEEAKKAADELKKLLADFARDSYVDYIDHVQRDMKLVSDANQEALLEFIDRQNEDLKLLENAKKDSLLDHYDNILEGIKGQKELELAQAEHTGKMLAMQYDFAEQSIGLARQAFADNKALALTMLAAEAAINISRIVQMTEVEVRAARMWAEIYGGPAGEALAVMKEAEIRARVPTSIAMVIGASTLEGINIAGQRASGGPVMAGSTYLVGERGPELFTPSTGGRIVPNDALAAGGGSGEVNVTQHITIDARGADASVMARIDGAMKKAKEETKAEIMASMNRGGSFARASGRI